MLSFLRLKELLFLLGRKLTRKKLNIKFILFIQELFYCFKLKLIFAAFLKRKNFFESNEYKNPIFLYDLRCSSITYDFLDYLFLANIWLKKFGYQKCDCIVYGNIDDFAIMKYRSYDLTFNRKELWERVDKIIKPLAESANFIRSTKFIKDQVSLDNILKESFIVYPPHYVNIKSKNIILEGVPKNYLEILTDNKKNISHLVNFLKPDSKSLREVREKLKISKNEKIVTFTVRDYKFEEIRNTNYSFLNEIGKFVKSKGYRFIVIPDYKNQSPKINEEIYKDCLIDIKKRIALYSISDINIGTAGGPTWLARYIPKTNMFITNIHKHGNHIGSFKDLRKLYGRGLKWDKQPFLDTDLHIIFGEENDISKLISYKVFNEILNFDNL